MSKGKTVKNLKFNKRSNAQTQVFSLQNLQGGKLSNKNSSNWAGAKFNQESNRLTGHNFSFT